MPYRKSGARPAAQIEVLLITSSSKRWIIPKGDIDGGMAPHLAAEREAFEEGGVRGRIDDGSIGTFRTCKEQDGAAIPVEVEVFPLEVTEQLDRWQEMEQRQRRWLPLTDATNVVEEPELRAILRSFAP